MSCAKQGTIAILYYVDQDPDLSEFLEKGCGCKRNDGKPCYTLFSRDHYEGLRMQCKELSWDELDLVLLRQISVLLSHDQDTNARKPLPRQRSSMAFYHGGVRICRKTFQKLHGIGIGSNTVEYTHTHTRTMYAHTHIHIRTHMHIHVRIQCIRTHTHAHVRIHIHTHTCTYYTCIHIHTQHYFTVSFCS